MELSWLRDQWSLQFAVHHISSALHFIATKLDLYSNSDHGFAPRTILEWTETLAKNIHTVDGIIKRVRLVP